MTPLWVRSIPIWVYAAIIALGIIGWQRVEVGHYKAQAITFKSAVLTFKSAQDTNLETIAKLQAANKAWADKSAADTVAAAKAAQDAKAYAESLQRAARAAQEALRHAYASHPTAKAWADVVVPEPVSRILRQ